MSQPVHLTILTEGFLTEGFCERQKTLADPDLMRVRGLRQGF